MRRSCLFWFIKKEVVSWFSSWAWWEKAVDFSSHLCLPQNPPPYQEEPGSLTGARQVRRGGRAGWGGEVSSILSLSFLSKNGVRFNVLSSTLDNFPFTRREMDIPTKKKQPLGPILHTETCFVFINQYGDTVSFVTLVPTWSKIKENV